jgi:hypothetical protein
LWGWFGGKEEQSGLVKVTDASFTRDYWGANGEKKKIEDLNCKSLKGRQILEGRPI